MAGTINGGLKARDTNIKYYGKDFYAKIGAIGGQKSNTGGFAKPIPCECYLIDGKHVKANCAGKKGGMIGKRGKNDTLSA